MHKNYSKNVDFGAGLMCQNSISVDRKLSFLTLSNGPPLIGEYD